MPRCQWCRQESQTADICEWCKRPMTPGWAPSAAPVAALPADRMTFQSEEPDRADRLLMYSMVGVVLLTGAVFAMSHFSKDNTPPPVQAAPAPIAVERSAQQATSSPMVAPAPVDNYSQYSRPAPVYQQPQTYSSPAPMPPARGSGHVNRKMGIWQDVVDEG